MIDDLLHAIGWTVAMFLSSGYLSIFAFWLLVMVFPRPKTQLAAAATARSRTDDDVFLAILK